MFLLFYETVVLLNIFEVGWHSSPISFLILDRQGYRKNDTTGVQKKKHNHHRNNSLTVNDIAVGEGRWVKFTTHISTAILSGMSTFHCSVLSTTQDINLPAALAAEMHTASSSKCVFSRESCIMLFYSYFQWRMRCNLSRYYS